MNQKRLSPREIKIFILTLIVLAVYLGFRFLVEPMKENTASLQSQITLNEKRLQKNLNIIRQKEQVGKEYEKYSSLLKQKSSDEQEMTSILSEIESAANILGLRLADMKPKKTKRVDFYNYFSVSLAVDGNLETITHFLYILQNAPYFLNADEVYFEKSSARTSDIRCRLSLSRVLIP